MATAGPLASAAIRELRCEVMSPAVRELRGRQWCSATSSMVPIRFGLSFAEVFCWIQYYRMVRPPT
jgi:hypothetical protein